MFCKKCGRRVTKGSTICPACNQPVNQSSYKTAVIAVQESSLNMKKCILAYSALLIVTITLICVISAVPKEEPISYDYDEITTVESNQ